MIEIALTLITMALCKINERDNTPMRKIVLYDDGSWEMYNYQEFVGDGHIKDLANTLNISLED